MENYGSLAGKEQIVDWDANGTEELALLKSNHEITNSESSSEEASKKSKGFRVSLLMGVGLWLVLMAAELSPFLFLVGESQQSVSASDDDDDSLSALWGSSIISSVYNVRRCSVEECLASPCQDSSSTPFVCLALKHNKKVRGGCGQSPWAFDICSDQCDTTGCSILLERYESSVAAAAKGGNRPRLRVDANNQDDCDVECPRQWCRKNRLCGDDENAPYQCTSGLSVYGCSSDKFEWTLRSSEAECSSCCKTTSCKD